VLRDLVVIYDREITVLDREIHLQLRHHQGYQAIQGIYGVGPLFAAVFVAEIGDVTRFAQQQAMSTNAGAQISTVNAGHLSLVTRPNAVTNIIETAVDATT